jgi:hypothetical protein
MLIEGQVTVFQWWLYTNYGGLRLARCVTSQHYFGTAILKVCRPLARRLISYSVPGNFMWDLWSTLEHVFLAVQASPGNNHPSNVP